MFALSFSTIEVGGDGRSYSIKFNNETVCAYSNGEDVTDDYLQSEDRARQVIMERFKSHEVEFYDFCHLIGSSSMTIDIGVDDDKFYTVSWDGEKITGTHELERYYVYKWYDLD